MNKPQGNIQRSTWVAIVLMAALAHSASAQPRAFMLEQGADPAGTPPGATTLSASPGAQVTVNVWFEDSAGLDELNSYVLILPWDATGGGGGTVSYVDVNPGMGGGNSVQIDKLNPQWVFTGTPGAAQLFVAYTETSGSDFGAFYSYLPQAGIAVGPGSSVPDPGGPNYVMQFDLQVSPDACGTFELAFNVVQSGFFNPDVAPYGGAGAVVFHSLNIATGSCGTCDEDPDCNDGNPCTDDSCDGQDCANTPNTLPCDDLNPCTGEGTCGGGVCLAGPPVDCDDLDDCTLDTCDPGAGCQHAGIFGQPCKVHEDCQAGAPASFCDGGSCACGVCGSASDCGDVNDDGIRDEPCDWYDCLAAACVVIPKVTSADFGELTGGCLPDGACDSGDRFHALNCFANTSTQGTPPYPCEANPPQALNVDAGSVVPCVLDGVCDAFDAFHALNCFANMNFDGQPGYPCLCAAPAPEFDDLALMGQRPEISLRASRRIRPGGLVEVDVHLEDAVAAVRGYQLHLGAAGGSPGALELVDIVVDSARSDYVFADGPPVWSAFNRDSAQMVAGMDEAEGVPARAGSYLATFIYRVAPGATGVYTVKVLHATGADPALVPLERTFLFGRYGVPIRVTAQHGVRFVSR